MISPVRPAALPLILAVLAALCLGVALTVQAQGQEITPTSAATGEDPPAQPANLQVSATHDSVSLTWEASSDQTVTHYAVLRRDRDRDASGVFHVIDANAGPGTGYTDRSVSAESSYVYRVKAVSPTGVSQWSGYDRADTPAAPEPTPTPTPTPTPESEATPEDLAPANLTAEIADDGGVALSWDVPAEDAESVTGYEVLRVQGEAELATLVEDTESTSTSYTDATATEPGETYAYRVKAIRGEEKSQQSDRAEVELPPDPTDLAPTNLFAEIVDDGGVALSWDAPAEEAESVTGYEVLRAQGEAELTTLVEDTESTATNYTDATATEPGEAYGYWVVALRDEERSQPSNRFAVFIPSIEPVTQEVNDPKAPVNEPSPSARQGPAETGREIWSATLTVGTIISSIVFGFSDSEPDRGGDLSHRTFSHEGVSYTIDQVAMEGSALTFRLDGSGLGVDAAHLVLLVGSRTFPFSKAYSYNASNYTYTWTGKTPSWSPNDRVSLALTVNTAPDAPTGLRATPEWEAVSLSWTPPASNGGRAIIKYQYRQSADGGSTWGDWTDTAVGGGQETRYTVTGLMSNTVHTFEVRAVNAVGESEASNPANAIPAVARVLGFTLSSNTLTEGSDGVTATVSISGETFASDQTIELSWGEEPLRNNETLVRDPLGPGTIKIPAGESRGSLLLTALENPAYYTPPTTRRLTATYARAEIGSVDLTYVDSGLSPTVTIAAWPAALTEGGEITLEVTLTRASDTAAPILLGLRDPDSVMTNGLPSDGLHIAPYQTTASVTLQTDDDGVAENDAVVTFTLSPNPAFPYTLGSPRTATVTVRDNESPSTEVTLSASPAAVGEGDGATELMVTGTLDRAPRAEATEVTLSVRAGTAAETTDYTAGTVTLTIPANQAHGSATLTLTPVADTVAEPDEMLTVEGAATGGLTVTGATVTILDDEPAITVSFEKYFHQWSESAVFTKVVVLARTASAVPPTRDFQVAVRSANDTAEAENGDFIRLSQTYTFHAADFVLDNGRYVHTVLVDLEILDDLILEKTEAFGLWIDASGVPPHVTFPNDRPAVVEIQDNDQATVRIADYFEVEEGEAIDVRIWVEEAISFPFTVVFSGIQQTATEGADYTRFVQVVLFGSYQKERTISIQTYDDQEDEEDETFGIAIVQNGPDAGISFTRDYPEDPVIVKIIDNDTDGTEPLPLRAGAGDGQVTLQWSPSKSSGEILRYEYRRRSPDAGEWTEIPDSARGGANGDRFTISGLVNNQLYIFSLRAVTQRGPGEQDDTTVTPRAGAPGPPDNLTATAVSDRAIRLSWTEPLHGPGIRVTGYNIEHSGDRSGRTWNTSSITVDPGITSITRTTGANRESYYRIRTLFTLDPDPDEPDSFNRGSSSTSAVVHASTIGWTDSSPGG